MGSLACTRTRTWGSLPIWAWARFRLKLYKFCAPRQREKEKEEPCNNYRQRRRFMACPLPPFPSSLSPSLLTLRVRSTRSLKFFWGHFACGAHTFSRGGTPHMFSIRFDLHTNFFFFPLFRLFFFGFLFNIFRCWRVCKIYESVENIGNICSQHFSTWFLANTASTVGWGREELNWEFCSSTPQSNTCSTRSSL